MTGRLRVLSLVFAVAAGSTVGLVILRPSPAAAQKNFDQPPAMNSAPARPPANSRNPRFTLVNNSSQIIDNLNISPANDDSWGDDLLGTLALPPHNRLIAGPTQDSGCVFDVRVVYHDHREEIMRRQDLCQTEELSFTGRNARTPKDKSSN